MISRLGLISAFAAALILLPSPATAADQRSIQGTLIDEDGKLVRGAEIRAKRLDAKAKVIKVTTDRTGTYVFESLPPGVYEVTAYLNGHPQSRAKVQTRSKGWARVNFDLRLNVTDPSSKDVDRMQTDIQTSTGSVLGR